MLSSNQSNITSVLLKNHTIKGILLGLALLALLFTVPAVAAGQSTGETVMHSHEASQQSTNNVIVSTVGSEGNIETNVDILQNGNYVKRGNSGANGEIGFNLAPGTYEIRGEGNVGDDNTITERFQISRNITVTSGNTYTPTLEFATVEIETIGSNSGINSEVYISKSGTEVGNDETETDGKVTAHVAPGTYEIRGEGNIGDDDTIDKQFHISQNITVAGRTSYTPTLEFATVKIETAGGTGAINSEVYVDKAGINVGSDDTESDGIVIAHLAPGTYELRGEGNIGDDDTIAKENHLSRNVTVVGGTEYTPTLEFATITIETVNANGAFNSKVYINQAGRDIGSDETESDGIVIANLAPGTYELRGEGNIGDDSTIAERFQISQNVTVTGRNTFTPTLEFATVEIETIGGNGAINSAVYVDQSGSNVGDDETEGDGKVTAHLAPGTYELRGEGRVGDDTTIAERFQVSENVTVIGGNSYTPTLEFSTVEIETVDADGGFDSEVYVDQSGRNVGVDGTESDGKVTAHLAPGTYELRGEGNVGDDDTISKRFHLARNATINGGTTYSPTLRFTTIIIETVGSNGAIDGDAYISQSGSNIGNDQTGNDGKVTARLAPGAYELRADANNTQLTGRSTFTSLSKSTGTFDFATGNVSFSQPTNPGNSPPAAKIIYNPKTPETGTPVGFDASQSTDPDGTLSSYQWDFDGDGAVEDTGRVVSNTYSNPGNYTVELTVTDNDGTTDTASQTISVTPSPSSPGSPAPPGDLTGNGQAANDIDQDGLYEDINGDGRANLRDLQPFFNVVRPGSSAPKTKALDFNGDGTVSLGDLQPFFNVVQP